MVNLFTRSTRVKASSGAAQETKNLVDGSPETSWTSAGDPASELDPASVDHTLWFSLRPDDEEPDSEDEDEDEEDEMEVVPSPLAELQSLRSLALTFQGGYSAISVTLDAKVGSDWVQAAQVWPEDGNATQNFALGSLPNGRASTFRLALHGSTDSFGRITLYGAALEAQQ